MQYPVHTSFFSIYRTKPGRAYLKMKQSSRQGVIDNRAWKGRLASRARAVDPPVDKAKKAAVKIRYRERGAAMAALASPARNK